VVLVGHSAGGSLAAQAALRQPERVSALILVDPALYTGGSPAFVSALINTPQGERVWRLVVRQLVEGDFFAGTGFYDTDAYYDETEEYYKITVQVEDWDIGLVELFSAPSSDFSYTEQFPELDIPVLLVQGAEDTIVAMEDIERAADAFPDAEIAVLDACGHFPHDECTGAFTDVVGTWLDAR
jgi:pimeloyl-ACP methyl ester carboxylesterase